MEYIANINHKCNEYKDNGEQKNDYQKMETVTCYNGTFGIDRNRYTNGSFRCNTSKKARLMDIAKKTGFGAGAVMCGLMALVGVGKTLGIIDTAEKDGDEKPSSNKVIFNRIVTAGMGIGFGCLACYLGTKAMPKTYQSLKGLFTDQSPKTS